MIEASETERVIGLFANDPSMYEGFLADFGGDPDEYGVEAAEMESFTSTSAAVGQALGAYLSDLRGHYPGLAEIDLDRVDWPTVSAAAEQQVLRRIGLVGLF